MALGVTLAARMVDPAAIATMTRPEALPLLVGAVAANAAGVLLSWLSWRRLLAAVAAPAGFVTESRIFFVAFLGKYVPGRVWGVLAQLEIGRRAGIAAGPLMAVFLLGLATAALTGAVVGLLAAPGLLGTSMLWLAAPAALAVVGYLRPELVYRLVARAARLIRRPLPDQPPQRRAIRRSVTAQVASWVVGGLHLWLLAIALGADPVAALPVCVGGFALASTAGMLVIVLPDGWGARDVLLGALLVTVLPLPLAGTAALASRVVCVVSELALSGGMLLAAEIRRRRPAPVLVGGVS